MFCYGQDLQHQNEMLQRQIEWSRQNVSGLTTRLHELLKAKDNMSDEVSRTRQNADHKLVPNVARDHAIACIANFEDA